MAKSKQQSCPCKVSMQKAQRGAAVGAVQAKVGDVADSFVLEDNQDGSFTVFGVSKAGNKVDISSVATLAVTSSDPAIVTVDAPEGMRVATHAVGPTGSVTLTITATWNDGSVGPFSIDLPGTVMGGPVSGLIVDFGTPTSH